MSNYTSKPLASDEQQILYQALCTIEDALTGGYHSGKPFPEFARLDASQTEGASIQAHKMGYPQQGSASQRQASQVTINQPGQPRGSHDQDRGDLKSIASELVRCRACRLAITRKHVVPGTGFSSVQLFVLGEYPSDESVAGLPFSQNARQLMDKMLAAIGLDRNTDCFETTAVKCRPPMDRDPAPDEVAACLPFLERQILAVQPKAILAFGRIPAQMLLGSKAALLRLRGTIHNWRGIPLIVTYHPEAILKDDSLKRPAWEDLKLLKTIIHNA